MPGTLLYVLGIAFASGIFIRSFYDFGISTIGLPLLVGSACMVAWRAKPFGFRSPRTLTGITLIAIAFGMLRLDVAARTPAVLEPYEGNEVSLSGRIVREPEVRATTIRLVVVIEDTTHEGSERVLVPIEKYTHETQGLSYGDTVRVTGTLAVPRSFATDAGREFDYRMYLKAQGVDHIIENGSVEVLAHEEGTFLGTLFRAKGAFIHALERIIPEPHAGLGEGILLGIKRALSPSLDEAFRKTGIMHIVVLSGYNIMIVVAFTLFLLSWIPTIRIRILIALGMVVLFALFVGPSASIVRASAMAALALIARGTGRTYAVMRALILTGIIMLIHNPHLLAFDPGFQLSFLATLGIILVTPLFESFLTRVPVRYGFRALVSATLGTQLFVLPLLLYHTGILSVVSLIVNILVLPMVPVSMFLTFAAGISALISHTLGLGVGYAAYLSLAYVTEIASFFASLPFASLTIAVFPFWVVLCVYALYAVILAHLYSHGEQYSPTPETAKSPTNRNDAYADWTIIEESAFVREHIQSPEALRASGDAFPFR